jgi:glycosyltransferase involved in cell wall biosynthesis
MKKITYILATNRQINADFPSVKSVLSLPKHEKEIIVTGPNGCIGDGFKSEDNIRFLEDPDLQGACQPINRAYKISNGDYIVVMADDISYPPNFLGVLDYMESDFMKKKRFKVANLMFDGGPQLYTFGHDALNDGESFWWPVSPFEKLPDTAYPYALIPMPIVARETIENEFSGHIYHPSFKHHYGDSWFGFYVSKLESFERFKWKWTPEVSYIVDKVNARCNRNHDGHDVQVFKALVQRFLQGHKGYV